MSQGQPRKPRSLIVIPAYNESTRLPRVLDEIKAYRGSPHSFDVRFLIVDDGSGRAEYEKTAALVRASGLGDAVSLKRLDGHQGKGGALRAGFLEGLDSSSDFLGFMDADGSVPVSELHKAIGYLAEDAHREVAGVIGSRVKLLGSKISRNAWRHLAGRIFATIVSCYFDAPIYDSQCGLKLFRPGVLRRYIDIPSDRQWVWDTQLILAMLLRGEIVHEIPVDWREVYGSRMSFLLDPWLMIARLLKFKRTLSAR